MIKGIGPVYAKKLVAAFAGDIFTIIENTPEHLREIEGVGKMRVGMITKGWQQQKHVRKIMLFLHGHGITTLRALRIYKTYGEGAIDVITHNPYQLARDIRGIGFLSADKIALKSGMAVDIQAGLHHALMTATDDGHCGLPEDALLASATELLQDALNPTPSSAVTLYGMRFGVGDKVIQTVNDYDKEITTRLLPLVIAV